MRTLPPSAYILTFCCLFGLCCIPLWSTEILPLRDYQSHLARMAIIADGGRTPFFADFYHIDLGPIGALAMDLLMPPMVRLIGLDAAARLFVTLTFLLMTSGGMALNRALFRRTTAWSLAGFLLLYNGILIWGFINYLFALGLFLWVLAGWFQTERWPAWLRIPCFSVLCYALLISHLYALALYGVCVMGAEVSCAAGGPARWIFWRRRRVWLALSQFALPCALFVLTSPTGGNIRSIGLFSVALKLHGLATLVHTGAYWADLSLSLAVVCLALWGWRRGWLALSRRMVWSIAALAILFVVMPDVIFHAGFADFRLPLAIALIAIAATQPIPGTPRREVWRLAALVGIAGLQVAVTTARWQAFDRQYAAMDGLLDLVPAGRRVLAVFAQEDKLYGLNEPPIAYEPELAGVRRHFFVNGAFVWPQDNSSLTLASPYAWLQADRAWFPEYYPGELAEIWRAPRTSPLSPFRAAVLADFDYLLIGPEGRFPTSVFAGMARVGNAGSFALYRIPDARL
ncbi:MAG: Conserved rane protein of unknown function [Rhodospirillales bacterium]|nr:Conserved rane protein of unknown function [Rhodospirillales bacterium]